MADIVLETTVPDAFITKVIDMLDLFSEKEIKVRVGVRNLRLIKLFTFTGIQDGESQKQFGERFIKEFMLNGLRIVEQHKTYVVRDAAVHAIDIPEEEVPDGAIDIYDVPIDDYDDDTNTEESRDYNNDEIIDEDDVEDWLDDMAAQDQPLAWYFTEEEEKWIMNIADLVITEQGLVNDGAKLMQIRFYPVETTTFTVE
jgi:hypothetical protein